MRIPEHSNIIKIIRKNTESSHKKAAKHRYDQYRNMLFTAAMHNYKHDWTLAEEPNWNPDCILASSVEARLGYPGTVVLNFSQSLTRVGDSKGRHRNRVYLRDGITLSPVLQHIKIKALRLHMLCWFTTVSNTNGRNGDWCTHTLFWLKVLWS